MEEQNKVPKVRLLEDKPISEDEFGGHAEVAKAIEHLVKNQKGGASIALIGKYGSGKSTVIKILKDKLKKDNSSKETEVFIYDAWSHQQDPLRRSYLEELLNFLDKIKWLKLENWQSTINRITKRVVETETETKPKFTPETYISAIFALVLLPLGLVIGSSVSSGIIEDKISPFHYLTFISFLLVLGFPILYFIIYSIRYQWKKRKKKLNVDWEPLNIFAYQDHKVYKDETITTPDPTAIEFRKEFQNICNSIFAEDKSRNLLLVIDNLDRLSSDKAVSVWATLLTYLNPLSFENKDWSDNLWVIVPFNIEALTKIWQTKNDEAYQIANLEKGFIEKTFQIRFNVSPPILSNWHEFFKEKLKYALPDENQDEFHKIVKLYESRVVAGGNPTPRQIKIFINNLGALYRQWFNDIPISDLAFYLMVEDILEDDIKRFISEENVKPFELYHLSGNWKSSLIAVFFNVSLKQAPEVLIEGDLIESFTNGESKKIEKYQDLEGFYNVVENKIKELSRSYESQVIANSAIALSNLQESTHESYLTSWGYLEEGLSNCSKISGELQSKFSKGVIAIWEKQSTSEQRKINFLRKFVAFIKEDSKYEHWFPHFSQITDYLERVGQIDLLSNIDIKLEDEEYLRFLSLLQLKGHAQYFDYLVKESKVNDLLNVYEKFISSGTLEEYHKSFPLLLAENKYDIDWGRLFDTYQNKIQVNKNAKGIEVEEILANLIQLDIKYSNEEASSALGNIVKKPGVFHYLSNHWASSDVVSVIVLGIMFYNPNANVSGRDGQSQDGIQKFNQFKQNPSSNTEAYENLKDYLIDQNILNSFIRYSQDYYKSNLFKKIIQDICDETDRIEHIDYKLIVEKYSELNTCLNKDYLKKFIDLIVNTNHDWLNSFLAEYEFDTQYVELYKRLLFKQDIEYRNDLIEYLKNGIVKVESEKWQEELEKDESSLLDIVTELNRLKIDLRLKSEFLISLSNYNRKLLKGEVTNDFTDTYWLKLYKSLSSDHQREYSELLISILVEEAGDKLLLLKLNSEILSECEYLSNNPQKIVELISSILESGQIDQVEWLKDNLVVLKKYILELKSNDYQELLESLSEISEHEDITQEIRISVTDILENIKSWE